MKPFDEQNQDGGKSNTEALKRLSLHLRIADTHSLHFVRVQPFERVQQGVHELERLVENDLDLFHITLPPNIESPIEYLLVNAPKMVMASLSQEVFSRKSSALFIFGLNDVLHSENSKSARALQNLNSQRDKLRGFIASTVFWVDEPTLFLIARSLPDLWSWVTSVTEITYPKQIKRTNVLVKHNNWSDSDINYVSKSIREHLGYYIKYGLVADPEIIEDVIQDTLLHLLEGKYSTRLLQNKTRLSNFARSVADVYIKRKIAQIEEMDLLPQDELEEIADSVSSTDDFWLKEDIANRVTSSDVLNNAITSLPVNERLILILAFFEDMTATDISRIADIPPSSVRYLLRRATERLRKRLEKQKDILLGHGPD